MASRWAEPVRPAQRLGRYGALSAVGGVSYGWHCLPDMTSPLPRMLVEAPQAIGLLAEQRKAQLRGEPLRGQVSAAALPIGPQAPPESLGYKAGRCSGGDALALVSRLGLDADAAHCGAHVLGSTAADDAVADQGDHAKAALDEQRARGPHPVDLFAQAVDMLNIALKQRPVDQREAEISNGWLARIGRVGVYKLIERAGVGAKFDPRKDARQGCLDSRSEHPQLKKGRALCQRLIAQLAADQRSQPLNRRTALRLAAEIELKAQISLGCLSPAHRSPPARGQQPCGAVAQARRCGSAHRRRRSGGRRRGSWCAEAREPD